jgi:hypothetical protein
LRAQRLSGPRDADPVAAVRAAFGLQAQDTRAALLAVRTRTEGATAHAVEAALHTGALVRAWSMRGTLHLLAAADLPLAIAIFGPLQLARGRRRLAQLGLDDAAAERSTAEVGAILSDEGPLTRHELAARLRERGVPVAAEGQAAIHVVHRAAAAGVLLEVGMSGRYAALDVDLPDRDAALPQLAARYATAHAPATREDFAAWSGLPAADVRTAWREPEAVDGDREPGGVRLLPAFDEWLLGWASRELVLPAAHAKQVAPGGGIIRPVAIADGRVFATWRLRGGRVEVEPFGRRAPSTAAEIEAVGAFLAG